jgi:serine/threonine-protein kinase
MNEHDGQLLRRRDTRSSGSRQGDTPSLGLPTDFVEGAAGRLGIAALIYAGTYLLAYGSGRLTGDWIEVWGSSAFPQIPDIASGAFIGLAIGVFFLTRSKRVECMRLLEFGLVWEVVAAVGIDFFLAFGKWPAAMQVIGISWVSVWIVFFPLIVPSTTGKTLVAALAAASATPVLYFIGVANGGPPLGSGGIVAYIVPNYICVGIAVVASRVVYRMGSDISRARQMGSYQLVEKLGEGGMGEVWKAEHRMLARPAAIKLIRDDAPGSGSGRTTGGNLQRFEREVQATSQLRSPHTVEVYDYGLTADRTFYYVMELLDGVSLEDLVKQQGPIPAARAVHVLSQACRSLAEAHVRDLVHRDIKPANVFICRYGLEYDFVKVLDFGLVKHAGTGPSGEVKLTEVGAFAGTPAYVSPESAMGEEVDGRTDIYSLGCVAYWLLTARTVFEAATPMQMLIKHVNDEPEPPSRRTELPIPGELDELILECLQKDKTRRPHSAEDLMRRLDTIRIDEAWTEGRARGWWDRHRPQSAQTRASLSREPLRPQVAEPMIKV